MTQTKLKRLTQPRLAFAVSGLILALGGSAFAQDTTYIFTANRGQPTDLNGSTVTIGNPTPTDPDVISWDIDFHNVNYTDGTLVSDFIISDDSSGFVGSFDIQSGNLFPFGSGVDFFGSDDGGVSLFGNPGGGSLVAIIDPLGSWTEYNGNDIPDPPAPDESSTLTLLAGALTALAGVRSRLQRRE